VNLIGHTYIDACTYECMHPSIKNQQQPPSSSLTDGFRSLVGRNCIVAGFFPGTVFASNSGSSKIFCTTSIKHCLMPSFVLADASKKSIPWDLAQASASSRLTLRSISILLPTRSLTTLSPLLGEYSCTSLSHWSRFSNVSVLVTSYTKHTPCAPR